MATKKSAGGLAAFLAAAMCSAAAAQTSVSDRSPIASAFEQLGRGRYAQALQTLKGAALDNACRTADRNAYAAWRQVSSYVSNVAAPTQVGPASSGPFEATRAREPTFRDALSEIEKRAAQTRVTILNEDHAYPRSRAFAYLVAKRLKRVGYDILAAETFASAPTLPDQSDQMAQLRQKRYPTFSTGTYTIDPVFAGFVRGALTLGYLPVSYEPHGIDRTKSPLEQIAQRDDAEARTLADVIQRHPNSRIFVYVGFDHAAEAPLKFGGSEVTWMAARLKGLTGINPLTIDQATFIGSQPPFDSDPRWTAAQKQARGSSLLAFDGNTPLVLGRYAGAVDLQVIHLDAPPVNGRPAWLADLGYRPRTAPQNLAPSVGTKLLQVYMMNDGDDAVPIDQVLWKAGGEPPTLMLPKGMVRYKLEDAPDDNCGGLALGTM